MASLATIFPTFTHWLGKLKRWAEADEDRYYQRCQELNFDPVAHTYF